MQPPSQNSLCEYKVKSTSNLPNISASPNNSATHYSTVVPVDGSEHKVYGRTEASLISKENGSPGDI